MQYSILQSGSSDQNSKRGKKRTLNNGKDYLSVSEYDKALSDGDTYISIPGGLSDIMVGTKKAVNDATDFQTETNIAMGSTMVSPQFPVAEISPPSSKVRQVSEVRLREISQEEFLNQEDLETPTISVNEGVEMLYKILKKNFSNKKAWEFIDKVARKPRTAEDLDEDGSNKNYPHNYLFLKHNPQILSPKLIYSLLVVGLTLHEYKDDQTGDDKVLLYFQGEPHEEGGMGEIHNILTAEGEGYKLKTRLVKTAHNNSLLNHVFKYEQYMASECLKLVDSKKGDERGRNILTPRMVFRNMILMDKITDENGVVKTLDDLTDSVEAWAHCLSGAFQGLSFLSENGILNADVKPANILSNRGKGIVIDWGGMVKMSDMGSKIKVIHEEGESIKDFPLELAHVKDGIHWTVPFTNNYMSADLISKELKGDIPPGTVHRFALYRMIESYFIERKFSKRKISRTPTNNTRTKTYNEERVETNDLYKKVKKSETYFDDLEEQEKLKYPPIYLDIDTLPPKIEELYLLYMRLHRDFNTLMASNNQKPKVETLSDRQIIEILNTIAN